MLGEIYTVAALTEKLRFTLETRFPFVWVRGEISNLSRPASGHLYFTLKDRDAQLQCVWFRGSQARGAASGFDPLTGEVYARQQISTSLQNGLEALCAGRISVYGLRGQYQLQIEQIQLCGFGGLAWEFEEKKKKLAALGFFAQERKRILPYNPARVALITSPGGAAVHDFLKLANNRGCASRIRLFPVAVQGDGAAAEIARAIQVANSQEWAQVIVIIRGGGALEDLWAFNDESLAYEIFNSRLPVLAAIGHEIDFTLADLTADVRGATPSHAAQLLWPLRSELLQRIDELSMKLGQACLIHVGKKENLFNHRVQALQLLSPASRVEKMDIKLAMSERHLHLGLAQCIVRRRFRLEELSRRLSAHLSKLLVAKSALYDCLAARLDAASPFAPLERGYALVYSDDGQLIRSVASVSSDQSVEVRVVDGKFDAITKRVEKIS